VWRVEENTGHGVLFSGTPTEAQHLPWRKPADWQACDFPGTLAMAETP